jgi:hypothetical protein
MVRPTHRHLERPLPGFIQRRNGLGSSGMEYAVVETALLLDGSCIFDTLAHLRRTGAAVLAAQLLIWHGGYFDEQIDAVEKRPADLA